MKWLTKSIKDKAEYISMWSESAWRHLPPQMGLEYLSGDFQTILHQGLKSIVDLSPITDNIYIKFPAFFFCVLCSNFNNGHWKLLAFARIVELDVLCLKVETINVAHHVLI